MKGNQRYIIMSFLAAGAVMGIALHGLAAPMMAAFEVPDPRVAGLVNASVLFGIVAGVVTVLVLMRNALALQFTDEAISELRKVTWPGREETIRSTAVVIITTFIIALSLASFDFVWARITSAFLFTEG